MKKAIANPPELSGSTPAARLAEVTAIAARAAAVGRHAPPRVIAITKTVDGTHIRPLLEAGHRLFGENRVQEAQAKWPALKADFPDVALHLVGQLQSNKALDAVRLFDAIHSLDRPSLIAALAAAVAREGRQPDLFVQVNLGEEPQKGGCTPEALPNVLKQAEDAGLEISGLMTVPPAEREPAPYFALLFQMARDHGLKQISSGMSSDFDIAAMLGSTYLRIGSSLFGERTIQNVNFGKTP